MGTRPTRRPDGPPLQRAELEQAVALWSAENAAYAYSFSPRLPRDFPRVPTRLVLAQWKQKCPQEYCSPSGPAIAVRYSDGELRVTNTAAGVTLFSTREEIRDRWLDFHAEIRFSRGDGGRVRLRLNDRLVADFRGVTAYPAEGGYPDRNLRYFKIGLHRDRTPEPMSIFLDEYKKRVLSAVEP